MLKKDNPKRFRWTQEAEQALQRLKAEFSREPLLRHFDPTKPIFIWADASGWAIAAILLQEFETDGQKQKYPIAFWSRKMTPAERNYAIPDQELLAIWAAMMTWKRYLEGAEHRVTVFSDHANLRMFNTTMNLNRRQVRWSLDLQRFDFYIEHRPGKTNPADGPSRRPDYEDPEDDKAPPKPFLRFALTMNMTTPPIPTDLKDKIRSASTEEAAVSEIYDESNPGSWTKEDGVYYWNHRAYVPEATRIEVLQHCHDSILAGHFGAARTLDLLTRTYYWPHMRESVRKYVKHCEECQKFKSKTHAPYGTLQPLGLPEGPWTRMGIDLITALPTIKPEGWNAIVVVVDHYTKMAHFLPAEMTIDAKGTANLLIKEVIRLHGVPQQIVCDRDARFGTEIWRTLGAKLGFKVTPSSAYHPQTDGQTERMNTSLEAYLRTYTSWAAGRWADLLPMAEFAYNNSIHTATGMSPFFANTGYHPRIDQTPERPRQEGETWSEWALQLHHDMDKVWAALNRRMLKAIEATAKQYDKHRVPREYKEGDKVWISTRFWPDKEKTKKLDERREGPATVLNKIGKNAYRLEVQGLPRFKNIHPVFHVSLLEPYNEPITDPKDLRHTQETKKPKEKPTPSKQAKQKERQHGHDPYDKKREQRKRLRRDK
ncbi:Transposon Tf2-8 polyprotein [Exophiala dermatitidis]